MKQASILFLIAALISGAVEIRPGVSGTFDEVTKDGTGNAVPVGWILNTGYAANGGWTVVPDTERGGHALAIAAERGPIHVYTEKGLVASAGTSTKVDLEVRGTGEFRIWLYCYGANGAWVGENVDGPLVRVADSAWQKESFDLVIPDKPFPKGEVGQIKLAIEVSKDSNLEFDNVTMSMEVEMEPTQTSPAGQNLRLLLPPVIYATPGLETNLYFANAILAINPANYAFDVTCSKGIQQEERWVFMPQAEDAGDYPLTLAVRDDNNQILASASTLLRVVPSKAKASFHVLMIGDSLTNASVYPAQVLANAEADDNLEVVLVGTNRPRGADSPVRHEGYGGWTAKMFVSYWAATPPEPPRRAHSPFLYREGDGEPVLDFPRYCREQNEGKAPDVVTFFLGCNDVFSSTDETIEARAADCVLNLQSLVGMVRGFGPDTRIGFLLPVPPAGSQDAFGANQGCGQTRWQYLRNQRFLLEQMLVTFGDREGEGIYLLPTFTALDTVHGFPVKTVPANSRSKDEVTRLNNGVHPAESGYQQIGDVVSAWLVYLANH